MQTGCRWSVKRKNLIDSTWLHRLWRPLPAHRWRIDVIGCWSWTTELLKIWKKWSIEGAPHRHHQQNVDNLRLSMKHLWHLETTCLFLSSLKKKYIYILYWKCTCTYYRFMFFLIPHYQLSRMTLSSMRKFFQATVGVSNRFGSLSFCILFVAESMCLFPFEVPLRTFTCNKVSNN